MTWGRNPTLYTIAEEGEPVERTMGAFPIRTYDGPVGPATEFEWWPNYLSEIWLRLHRKDVPTAMRAPLARAPQGFVKDHVWADQVKRWDLEDRYVQVRGPLIPIWGESQED